MKSCQRGFNLLELMIAITVTGVLVAIGVPSLRDMTLRQKITASTQDLQLDLTLARQEAITRGAPVSVCTSSDGANCDNATWSDGRIIFADPNTNGTLDAGEEVIKFSKSLADGLSGLSGTRTVTFDATGAVPAAMVINLCKSGFKGRNIILKRTGHPMVQAMTVNCP
jgi:type IV fimbrial biogenesis protein FimT